MQYTRTLGLLLTVIGAGRATSAAAQLSPAAHVGLFSNYLWRGVTYTNRPVLQPALALGFPVQRVSFTAGVWANIEPGRYNGFSDISESGGETAFDLTEIDWVGEVSAPISSRAAVALGATAYIYPNQAGITSSENTVELYGRLEFTAPLDPLVSVYYDVGAVRGAYFEGEIGYVAIEGDRLALTFGALAGLSAGQDAAWDDAGEPQAASYNFERNGFTHADFWATADVTAGRFSIAPTLHLILTGDDATKASKIEPAPGTGAPQFNRTGMKLWFGISLGWIR